jgi:superfamily II helicase
MILSKIAKVRTNSRIRKFYDNLGLDTSGEFIEVPIDLLTKGSHSIISCECDFCGDKKQMSFKTYNNHIKFDGLYYCNKCCLIKKEKILKINLNRLVLKNMVMNFTKNQVNWMACCSNYF